MRKLLHIFLLFPFLGLCQIQIGNDLNSKIKDDKSGHLVSLSNDGNIIAIGAPDNNGSGQGNGHVCVYKKEEGVWSQIGINVAGKVTEDVYGLTISLSTNGSIIAIGSSGNDGNGKSNGSVRIYKNELGTWTQIGGDIRENSIREIYGLSVSLSGNGDVVAIGSMENDINNQSSGQVRIYKNESGTWTQIGSNINDELLGGVELSVNLSGNGNIVAVGYIENNKNSKSSGRVRVYKNISRNWTQIGIDISSESIKNNLSEVKLSDDGSIIAIGTLANANGYVRVYKNELDNWTQIGDDIISDSEIYDSGYALDLSDKGNVIAIGFTGSNADEKDNGYVSIYKNKSGFWTKIGSDIESNTTDEFSGFGSSISLSGEGNSIAIGATWNDGNNPVSGEVSIYDLSIILSKEEQTLLNFNLYPNPTKTQFTIKLENTTELKNVNIYNNLGQLILTSKKSIINISKLTSGLYVVEIETNKGKASKKLIIE